MKVVILFVSHMMLSSGVYRADGSGALIRQMTSFG
jgi:hypothetical protein